MLILDEPTHNLDSEAINTLSQVFEENLPNIVSQALVISHEENLINSEFAKCYRFKRDKTKDTATEVEEI